MRKGGARKICDGGIGRGGKQNHDARPATGLAFDVHQSAICGDDAADRGQSQARALSGALSGKERIEEMLAGF